MIVRRFLTFCYAVLVLLSLSVTSAYGQDTVSEHSQDDVLRQLKRLDTELGMRSHYIAQRQKGIDSLKRLNYNHQSVNNYLRLGQCFVGYRNDSAIVYYTRGLNMARNLPDTVPAVRLRLLRAALLPQAGFLKSAISEYEAVDPVSLNDTLKAIYYDTGRQMYSYIASFFPTFPTVGAKYRTLSHQAQMELLTYLDPASPWYKLNLGEDLYTQGEYTKAWEVLQELVDSLPETENLYARATHMLADISHIMGRDNDYVYYLTLSAISDTRSATLEVTSLQELGERMFVIKDVERAHRYLYTALRNAVECHAETRMLQTAYSLPLIESVHQAELKSYTKGLKWLLWLLGLVSVALLVLLVVLRRQMSAQHRLQVHLEESNKVKELYISQFLNMCSMYIDKLNQTCSLVSRKIAAGHVEELGRLAKSGKLVENEAKTFYDTFDDAFLHIYPGFVDKVNELLRPEERIVLQEGEQLNTDLRILAFMRLGIEESTRIAQILNYSVNTIYTYRNKLRNKAIDRDTFEESVKKII